MGQLQELICRWKIWRRNHECLYDYELSERSGIIIYGYGNLRTIVYGGDNMKSVSAKVILVFMILILPLNVMVIGQANSIMTSAVEQVVMAEQKLVDSYADMLGEKMDNSVSLLHYFRTKDTSCLSMVLQKDINSYKYQGAKYKLYADIKQLAEMMDGSQNYFYYFPLVDDILVVSNPYVGRERCEELKKAITDETISESMTGWHIVKNENGQLAFLYVKLKNISYGTWIDLNTISENILSGIKYKNVDFVFSEDQAESGDGENVIPISAKVKNLQITLNIERQEIVRTEAVYQRIMMNIATLYLVLVPVLFLIIRRILINPLRKINGAHQNLKKGELDFRLEENVGSQEFREAYQSFNTMADALKKLCIQTYEDKIEKQKMELRNLQLQIRPHFLLNTFNLVYSLAEKKESEPIQRITIYLSDYFRYIFRSGKSLELFQKELHLIEGYVYMASIRYENLVELSVDVDPEIFFVRTPPLLIHNFVENAVKYGFHQGKSLSISLEGRYDDGWVVFQIMDDGNGMNSEVLERNKRMFRGEWLPEDKTSHLGLYNSYKRLKYFYGETAKLEVESEVGVMSCFTISFPYDLEVNDESFSIE